MSKSTFYGLLYVVILLLVSAVSAFAQSLETIKVETASVSFSGLNLNPSKVEVVRTKGSRIVVETTVVSTTNSFKTNEQVLKVVTPQATVVEGVTQLSVSKQVFVNSSQATVNYKIFVPHGIEILN